ncbi:hypothetical protein [Marilutibacter aestuarii]|uniref:Uncharacterized protein n=1 Tax=Marilutibacter aestuarii TaxID=1706195 RepID=A0A508A7V0_9GAMM|nr:hypothetical protein [Lysobacter aestuarii]TQD43958.1 hypothetical protein FKV25_09960 [Lysobacter aestuarii]
MNTRPDPRRDGPFDANPAFPFHLHWDADQLAAAVPARLQAFAGIEHLHELMRAPANSAAPRRRRHATSYLPPEPAAPLFRVR